MALGVWFGFGRMAFGGMVLGAWFWAYVFGRMVLGVWFWAYGFGRMVWLLAYGFWVYGFGCMVFGVGVWAYGVALGLWFWAYGHGRMVLGVWLCAYSLHVSLWGHSLANESRPSSKVYSSTPLSRTDKILRIHPVWLVIRDNRRRFSVKKLRTYRDWHDTGRYCDYQDPGQQDVSVNPY